MYFAKSLFLSRYFFHFVKKINRIKLGQCCLFSKSCLPLPCPLQRPAVDEVLREGHISLSGLQLRAHAMFSAEGLPLGSDTLEYAWLIDVQAGSLTAKVTAPQVPSRNHSEVLTFFLVKLVQHGFLESA